MSLKKYKVWWPDNGQTKEDARIFEDFDHEGAAAAWANWYDGYSSDYLIVGGETPTVQVLREDETDARAVLVMGETTRIYSGHLAA